MRTPVIRLGTTPNQEYLVMKNRFVVLLTVALVLGLAAGTMLVPSTASAQGGPCEDDLCNIHSGQCFDAQQNRGFGCDMCSGCTFGCTIYPCV